MITLRHKFNAYRREYSRTPKGKEVQKRYNAKRRARKDGVMAQKANNDVGNALRKGELIKKPCMLCGDIKTQAHHWDYTKTLDVWWYCNSHHRQHHHTFKGT